MSNSLKSSQKTLREFTIETVNQYLAILGHCQTANLYKEVLQQVEIALFEAVLKKTKTKTKAASILGINRTTLRKKIEEYNITVD